MPEKLRQRDDFRQTAIVASLRRSKLFGGLSEGDIEQVAQACVVKSLARGQTLFREGEKAEGFYVIQTGAVKVYRLTPDGREQIIHVFRAPESFAEVVLATKETYPANAEALQDSQLILVRKERFLAWLEHKPSLALLMLVSMSAHLKHLVTSLQDIKGRQIDSRLAAWLLQQVPESAIGAATASSASIADASEQAFVIRLHLSKKVLAGQMGVTSETLSRTFARLREEGILEVKREYIHVLDPERLRACAAGDL